MVDLMTRVVAADTAPHPAAQVLQTCLRTADSVRSRGGLVVFVRSEHPGVDTQPPGGELASGCEPGPGDLEIVKSTWSAFHGTHLDEELRARDVTTVALGGIATTFGVESTGRAADEHGYSTLFLTDAMSGLHSEAHDFSTSYVFPRIGTVFTSDEFIETLT
nr:isochorismatase family protein [Kineosporia babensis]